MDDMTNNVVQSPSRHAHAGWRHRVCAHMFSLALQWLELRFGTFEGVVDPFILFLCTCFALWFVRRTLLLLTLMLTALVLFRPLRAYSWHVTQPLLMSLHALRICESDVHHQVFIFIWLRSTLQAGEKSCALQHQSQFLQYSLPARQVAGIENPSLCLFWYKHRL